MKKIFNDWKMPLILFPIWVLVYVFIGPSFPYIKSFHSSKSILIAGTILSACLLSFALFLSYRAAALSASMKCIVTTLFLFLVFGLTVMNSIHLVTVQFQTVAYFNDASAMGKSSVLNHSRSAWQNKDWEKGPFLAKWVFRDYGVRMAYHNKNGDVIIFKPDDKDLSRRDRNMDSEEKARKLFPVLLDQAKRHQVYSYIYFGAFFVALFTCFLWDFLNNRKRQSR